MQLLGCLEEGWAPRRLAEAAYLFGSHRSIDGKEGRFASWFTGNRPRSLWLSERDHNGEDREAERMW